VRTSTRLLAVALAAGAACRGGKKPPPASAARAASRPAEDGGPAPADAALARLDAGPEEAPVVEAAGEPVDLPVRFTCVSAGNEIRLGTDGRGTWKRGGGEARPLAVPLVNAGDVASVRCGSLADGVLLLLGLADERAAWGEVARLGGDPPSLRFVAYLPGLPGGEPLLFGRHLYLGAVGFAGKLDLDSGRWEWSQRGLEEARAPRKPVLSDGVVEFPDASGEGLRADEETGVLVRVAPDGGPEPGVGEEPDPRPDAAEARRLAALASGWFPGFSWRPSSFWKLDLDGDGQPDYALLGTGPEMLAVVVVEGPLAARPRHEWLLLHTARAEEAELGPERLKSPPSTLVCPVPEEPARKGAATNPIASENRAECEAFLRRRAALAEMDERNVRGLALTPLGVHLFFDPETRRLAHWGP